MIEKQIGKQINRLRIDNGMELCGKYFNEFYKNEGIVRQRTVRHTPQKNGVVEQMNRTVLEKARFMLSNAGWSKEFWAKVVNFACYLMSRSPLIPINCKTPEEVWSGSLSNYVNLRIFCCFSYAHVK